MRVRIHENKTTISIFLVVTPTPCCGQVIRKVLIIFYSFKHNILKVIALYPRYVSIFRHEKMIVT